MNATSLNSGLPTGSTVAQSWFGTIEQPTLGGSES
jgi:hypothetical protein